MITRRTLKVIACVVCIALPVWAGLSLSYFSSGLAVPGDFSLDDSTGDSPILSLVDQDDKYLRLQKLDTGNVTLICNEGGLFVEVSNDTDDYLTLTTVSDVPTLATVGSCDLAITASSGNITFDDENLTTTGTITGGSGILGNVTVDSGSITDAGGNISFGDENLTTTGAVNSATLTTTSTATIGGDVDIGTGNVTITAATGDVTFAGNITGASGILGNVTVDSGSITDAGGNISFGDENLTTTGTITMGGMSGAVLDGGNAALTAAAATTPGLTCLFISTISAGAAGDVNITVAGEWLVVDAWAIHTGGAGEGSDTLQLFNGANAISDAIDWSGADTALARAGSLVDNYQHIADGGTLKWTTTDNDAGTDVGAGIAYVLCVKVAP